jgi:ABC-type multidrug transport system fused ATPase/permease subunit
MVAALERRRGVLTSFVVTHRPSIVKRADILLEIQNSQVRMRQNEPVLQGRAVS